MIDLRELSDDRIEREIAGLLEKAAHCSPGCSLLESVKHSEFVRRLAALRDEQHRRHRCPATPATLIDFSRGRRKRRASS